MAYHLSVVEIIHEINQQDTSPSPKPRTPEMSITLLVRKNQTALVDAINKALDEIKADGTYKTISLRYFGQDISQ